MELSKRLQKVADFVDENSSVADIGTDHGYIPVYLIKNKIAKKAIAADISKGSLDKAIGYINDLNLNAIIDTRLGNGLEVLEVNEVDTVIIAGMGGILITEILEASRELVASVDQFIFQPMLGSEKLRKYLIKNDFTIVDEAVVKENQKFYEIIKARHKKVTLDKKLEDLEDIDYEISQILLDRRDEDLKEFIEYKIKYNKTIMDRLDSKTSEKSRRRFRELEAKNKDYREVLNLYEGN